MKELRCSLGLDGSLTIHIYDGNDLRNTGSVMKHKNTIGL
jgi:hypothetical protein